MALLSRTDRSLLANWWWTVDRWSLAAIITLIVSGVLLSLAASPAVAGRIGLEPFYFVYRQLSFVAPALVMIFIVSLCGPREVRRLALGLYGVSVLLMVIFVLLVVGCYLETIAALIIIVPILMPVAHGLGVNRVHFGVLIVCALTVGFLTPPVGINLFAASAISGVRSSASGSASSCPSASSASPSSWPPPSAVSAESLNTAPWYSNCSLPHSLFFSCSASWKLSRASACTNRTCGALWKQADWWKAPAGLIRKPEAGPPNYSVSAAMSCANAPPRV